MSNAEIGLVLVQTSIIDFATAECVLHQKHKVVTQLENIQFRHKLNFWYWTSTDPSPTTFCIGREDYKRAALDFHATKISGLSWTQLYQLNAY